MALIECRDCGEMFDPKKKARRGGYYNQCPACSSGMGDREKMYVGRCGSPHKGAEIEIFRENLSFFRTALRRESACGMSPNLGISATTNPVGREIKAEKK